MQQKKEAEYSTSHLSVQRFVLLFFSGRAYRTSYLRLCFATNTFSRNLYANYLIIRWRFKHELCEYLLNYRPKSSCSCLFFNSPLGYLSLCVLCDLKINVVKLEKLRVLLDKRVLWLCQDPAKCVLVKLVKNRDNRKSAHKLRYDTELNKIVWYYMMLLSSSLLLTFPPKPSDDDSVRFLITLSSPSKAPPQINRMFLVSICMNS